MTCLLIEVALEKQFEDGASLKTGGHPAYKKFGADGKYKVDFVARYSDPKKSR